jgi:hypothetical protein
MNDLIKLLRQLEAERFFGSVEAKFESGQVVVVKKTETIKPNNCRDSRGVSNVQPQY